MFHEGLQISTRVSRVINSLESLFYNVENGWIFIHPSPLKAFSEITAMSAQSSERC